MSSPIPAKLPYILPEVFSQIMEGDDEREYILTEGRFVLELQANDWTLTGRVTRSSGSLNVSYMVSYVRSFFNMVKLREFYPIDDPGKREVLDKVFRAVVGGKKESEHQVPDIGTVTVSWNKDTGLLKLRHPSTRKIPDILEKVDQLVQHSGIHKYFDGRIPK